jgi:hypothetical protein
LAHKQDQCPEGFANFIEACAIFHAAGGYELARTKTTLMMRIGAAALLSTGRAIVLNADVA